MELSRLELVVLADMLVGLSVGTDAGSADVSTASTAGDSDESASERSCAVEMLVEAHAATVVLHEAVAFAENPGPHSFVLNMSSTRLHLGGGRRLMEGQPDPMINMSAGDLCVHETLREPRDDSKSSSPEWGFGPMLFARTGDEIPNYPAAEDLAHMGFVSTVACARTCIACGYLPYTVGTLVA